MALKPVQPEFELINVHRVKGDKDIITFLKNADHEYVEGLFYHAKRYGQTEFTWHGLKYILRRNKDTSFSIVLSEEQEITTEQFA